ncbi:macro domain-containing protein [Mycolicibacterium sp. PAM1]|uniref:macro domain-containing protein n=1 Tax=Mycolicibacterium sp. PAM1 TaxID=2853535 RepID=UPI000A2F7D1C|nr:macro domain-containing protein [Mycolicibacterium sp. PAM1]MBV5247066.1 macro domain-containing protein [Mycolicibacterium sp. PAM1]
MLTITAVRGDITEQEVDAVVNPANTAMRGGGGADGAIHRAGGPAILRDCVKRFPDGLATGDAGWTTAGDLPAQWVIHTVGPNYDTGQRNRSLLESCYRRALKVADELGARIVAFPLISTGSFGWPRQDAIAAAIETIAAADTRVDEARLVAFDPKTHEEIRSALATWTPIRILQGVQVLHQRGYHRIRVWPGVSPSGMYWRVAINTAGHLTDEGYPEVGDYDTAVLYPTGSLNELAGNEVTVTTRPEMVADLILEQLPEAAPTGDDPAYVSWFAELMRLVEQFQLPPIAYAEYFDASAGWEIGWGSGNRHPCPPKPAITTRRRSAPMPSLPSTSMSDNTANALYRLETILQKATGLSPKVSAVEGTLIPRGDPLLPGVTIKFAATHARGADRAALFFDDKNVHLGVWPAELQPQYTYVYSDPARVEALLDLDTHGDFTVEPNFQLAHRFAQPLQRWFPTRLLSAEDYLQQWVDDFHDGRAGGRTRDELADPGFFQWLAERRYASAAEEESLHHWLDSKKAGIQFHVRPGVQILRTWLYEEAFAIEGQNEFAVQVRNATNQILIALGQAQ